MHVFPHHEEAIAAFNNISTHASFVLHQGPYSLQGLKLSPWIPPSPVTDDPDYVPPAPLWETHSAWRTSFAPGETVISTVRSATALTGIPPASHGRVLGDRTTLYKYENQHLIAVLTESRVRTGELEHATNEIPNAKCTVYLLDSIKGAVLYSAVVPAARDSLKGPKSAGGATTCQVKMSLVENWLVYHYYDDDASDLGARGWRMVSVELYEGGANVKTRRYARFFLSITDY